jgi:hypothetical protein
MDLISALIADDPLDAIRAALHLWDRLSRACGRRPATLLREHFHNQQVASGLLHRASRALARAALTRAKREQGKPLEEGEADWSAEADKEVREALAVAGGLVDEGRAILTLAAQAAEVERVFRERRDEAAARLAQLDVSPAPLLAFLRCPCNDLYHDAVVVVDTGCACRDARAATATVRAPEVTTPAETPPAPAAGAPPAAPIDPRNYTPISKLVGRAGCATDREVRAAIARHNIRTWKPSRQRLSVHLGDWARMEAAWEKGAFDARDATPGQVAAFDAQAKARLERILQEKKRKAR